MTTQSTHEISPHNLLYLFLPLGVDFLSVLWPHQHDSKGEGRATQTRAVALDDSRGEDGHDVWGWGGREGGREGGR